jgi:lysophospholipase L1-like esterase
MNSAAMNRLFAIAVSVVACLLNSASIERNGAYADDALLQIPIDDANIVAAPYVWKSFGTGPTARIEATMPGAYFKAVVQGSTTIGVTIDSTANVGCPTVSMPVIEYSVDAGPYKVVPLVKTGEVYTFSLATGLDAAAPHRLDFFFRAADLGQNRWRSSIDHLRIAGLAVDAGGSLQPCSKRPKKAIGFGDSITEGVGVDGLFTSWQKLDVNNARASWFPIVCSGLNCEYGQLGSGGQGMVNKVMAVPPLPQTWDHYDAATSRLTGKLLLPEPDYVFCAMGTNDFEQDISRPNNITEDYTRWLVAVREACPNTRVFCVVPPFGWHIEEIRAAVAARNQAGDARVHLIDTAAVKDGFRPGTQPTQLAYDGVHPSVYGNALLATTIAVEVQKVLSKEAR